jgi:hypothetical protein
MSKSFEQEIDKGIEKAAATEKVSKKVYTVLKDVSDGINTFVAGTSISESDVTAYQLRWMVIDGYAKEAS